MRHLLLAAMLCLTAPAFGQTGGQPGGQGGGAPRGDAMIERCAETEVRLRNLSPAAVAAVCEQMRQRLPAPLRASQLRDMASATADLAADGWMAAPGEIARQLVAVIALRGQEGQPRLWRQTAELLVRIHAETDAHVTPGHLSAALGASGVAALTLDDEGLRRLAANLRERQRRGG